MEDREYEAKFSTGFPDSIAIVVVKCTPILSGTVPSRQDRCALHDHDSYGLWETCAEIGFIFSIFHSMCLVVAEIFFWR
jgi:hypothetical protein